MSRSFIIGTTSLLAVLFSFAGFDEVRDEAFLAAFDETLRRVRGLPLFGSRASSVDLAKIISDWLAIINLPYSILFGLNLPVVPHDVSLDGDDPFCVLSFATF